MSSFRLPDPEELERSLTKQAIRTVPTLVPFNIENWPPALRALSVQRAILDLSSEEVTLLEALIEKAWGDRQPVYRGTEVYSSLLQGLNKAILEVGGRAFTRLSSRSPKDNLDFLDADMRMVPITRAQDAIAVITTGSDRALLDLADARRASYMPRLCVRRFIDFDLESEFRCFVEDSVIVGMTQYNIQDGPFRWIVKNANAIEQAIRSYVYSVLVPTCDFLDFSADIIIRRDMVPFLLEINPLLSMGRTSHGLFNGSKDDADGTFRYLGKPKTLA